MAEQCALKSLPGLQISNTENHRERNKASTPQITLTPASPAVPQKAHSRSTSPTLMLCDSPVRPPLKSYTHGSEEQRLLYDDIPMQVRHWQHFQQIYKCVFFHRRIIKITIFPFYRYHFKFQCVSPHIT